MKPSSLHPSRSSASGTLRAANSFSIGEQQLRQGDGLTGIGSQRCILGTARPHDKESIMIILDAVLAIIDLQDFEFSEEDIRHEE
jgi:hypothetical protein